MADDPDMLKQRIAAAKQRRDEREQGGTHSRRVARLAGKEMGIGMKVGTTLFASIIMGLLLGFGVDTVFDSRPFGLIICLLLALAAGIRETWKTLKRLEAEAEARRAETKD